MSFTNDVKDEVALIDLNHDSDLLKAELAAFVKMSGTIVLQNHYWKLILRTEHPKILKRLYGLIKQVYQLEPHIVVMTKVRLKKNHIFQLEVRNQALQVLEDLHIDHLSSVVGNSMDYWVHTHELRKAFLTGAFLAAGSVNSPTTSNYHFELTSAQEDMAVLLQRVLQKFDLEAKILARRSHWMVYLKKSEQIADFLKIIRAQQAVLSFEEERIERDQYISMSRIINCEVANEVKSQESAKRQVEWVEVIVQRVGLGYLEPKLIEIAQLRLEFPEANLNELVESYQEHTGKRISKSGLNHRLMKLKEIALQLERGTSHETKK